MKPYLIQRATFKKDNAFHKGIDALLSFDYMGSAEFEFGALPKSLKRIREESENYTQFQYSLTGKTLKVITVLCRKGEVDEVCSVIEKLSKNEYHLKEFSAFDKWVKDDGYFKDRYDFWWDIDNDFMFWKFTPDFDLTFKNTLFNKEKP